jgi:hypothetical protein
MGDTDRERGGVSHLDSAARALERVLKARHPEHEFIVDVLPDNGHDATSTTTTLVAGQHPGASSDDAHPVSDSRVPTTPSGPHHDALKKAA